MSTINNIYFVKQSRLDIIQYRHNIQSPIKYKIILLTLNEEQSMACVENCIYI